MAETSNGEVVVNAGAIRFEVEYRRFGGDRGAAIRVHGDVNGADVQLLRFDCFEKDPHYHYDPDGKNQVLHLDPESDTETWSADHIERNLKIMVRLAGYPDVADKIDMDKVRAASPHLRKALSTARTRG